jgi:hypothetical protein
VARGVKRADFVADHRAGDRLRPRPPIEPVKEASHWLAEAAIGGLTRSTRGADNTPGRLSPGVSGSPHAQRSANIVTLVGRARCFTFENVEGPQLARRSDRAVRPMLCVTSGKVSA